MESHNRDVFPAEDVCSLYSSVASLITNRHLDSRFIVHEQAAVRAKKIYHRMGRAALMFIVLSAIFTIAEALVVQKFSRQALVEEIFLSLGTVGLAMQLYLIVTHKKQAWLLNRFAAERLRSLKFQAFPLASIAKDSQELAILTDTFYIREVARLDMEMNAGDVALALFKPREAIVVRDQSGLPENSDLEHLARDAYLELRLSYQVRFATGEIDILRRKQRVGLTSTDILYLLGAGLSILSLCSKVFLPLSAVAVHWVDFTVVTAFLVGLSRTLLDNASLAETSTTRYEEYVKSLQELDPKIMESTAPFCQAVVNSEHVILGELGDFCTSAQHISYRI